MNLLKTYPYAYPEGLKLRPDSKLHNQLVGRLMELIDSSHSVMSRRYSSWNKIDRTLTAYISLDEEEEALKDKDDRKPVSIIFPYSYAILEILISNLMTIFVKDPIFTYEAGGPEDVIGAKLLERVVQHHCYRSKVGLSLHTMFRDCLCYGLGAVTPGWEIRRGTMVRKLVVPRMDLPLAAEGVSQFKQEVEGIVYEGNRLDNISPYDLFPDPNVGIHDIQRGEFVGWLVRTNYNTLLREEQEDDRRFNARYLRDLGYVESKYGRENSARDDRFGSKPADRLDRTNRVDVIYIYVDLIPEEWGLGDSDLPEKWLFGIAGDEVLIAASRLDMYHNMFPIAIAAPDFDGYSAAPMGRLEILYGLQNTLDWLFNSHIANVRKAVNDMFVVDPSIINMPDLLDDNGAGKIIRINRPAWGRGTDNSIKQLTVSDITRGNIADSSFVVQWMQRVAAADDSMAGFLRASGPDRLSAQEFKSTREGALGRITRVAYMVSLQAMQDIGYMFATNIQQLMTQDLYLKTVGKYSEELKKEYGSEGVVVSPLDMLVNFDVTVHDGSTGAGGIDDLWVRLFDIATKNEELSQRLDVVRVFKHMARELGAKNVDDFDRQVPAAQPQIMPDQQVEQQLEAGNIRPLGG